jgi:Dyp-type peroxidase family
MLQINAASGAADPAMDWRIDNEDPVAFPGPHDRLLERLQGNIVKGHGRDFTVNIFLRFANTARPGEIRRELKRLAKKYVKSAAHQLVERADHRTYGLPGGLFANLFLTRTAYIKFACESKIPTWFHDVDFRAGMKAAAGLQDVIADPVEPLETAYASGEIDALLLLADDDEDYLLRRARQAVTRMHDRRVARAIAIERGRVLRNQCRQGIEHFGYVDGRSQPLFLASDFDHLVKGRIDPDRTKERVASNESRDLKIWNPFAKLSLALLPDPGVDDPDAFGSYYAFRKLEQNVRGFMDAERGLARALGLCPEDPRAGAMAVGRFRDGTPLVLSDRPDASLGLSNDFRYDDLTLQSRTSASVDRFGLKCPFQAHIRKVTPRQDEALTDAAVDRRLVRRGITYGVRPDLDSANGIGEPPTKDVGLLFACFQRSIAQQFTFVQAGWANNPGFPLGGGRAEHMAGVDPVIGQGEPSNQNWRREYGGDLAADPPTLTAIDVSSSHSTSFSFNGFVKFRGGDFFFAPSLPFLLGG